jgi:hypothetical protein
MAWWGRAWNCEVMLTRVLFVSDILSSLPYNSRR